MAKKLTSYNKHRNTQFRKDEKTESFISDLNSHLVSFEKSIYSNDMIDHPFIFVFGLPRSGTTMLSQLLAYHLKVGYVNNFIARFWKSPVTGIKLYKAIEESVSPAELSNSYGATQGLNGIHEYGYFWREWLKKDTMEGVRDAAILEENIDWEGLKFTLANMQHQFNSPMVFKNIFGSYHMSKLIKVLGKVLFIYIERDELDVAISILNARKKYYSDLNNWWSYLPPDYEKIINLDYWNQIAGQIYYLKKYYDSSIEKLDDDVVLKVSYKTISENPNEFLKLVQSKLKSLYDYNIDIVQSADGKLAFSSYENEDELKNKFQGLINNFKKQDP